MRQSLFEVRGESIEEGIAYLLVPIAPLSIVSLDNGDLNDIVPLGEELVEGKAYASLSSGRVIRCHRSDRLLRGYL